MDKKCSSIRDNKERGSVGDFLKSNIDSDSKLSIVSAYFTIYAYYNLKDKLDNIEELRFLFGEPTFIQSIDPSNQNYKAFKIENDELTIPFETRLQQKLISKECSDWIEAKVQIRSMVKPDFLHGKMYHIQQNSGVMKAIFGSSNFTARGLGFGNSPNIELNLGVTDDRDREDLLSWFNEIWNSKNVEDVKRDVLKYLEQLYKENDPEFIYFKTLYHIFEEYLLEQEEEGLIDAEIGLFDTKIWNILFNFQKDAAKGALNKTIKYNGCIIADSVGLGKTFEALAIIKYFELKNERVLVLAPKRLRENWALYKRNDKLNPLLDDRFNYDILNHTDLSRETGMTGDINLATLNWSNYDLVVIDESHNFRNNIKSRYEDGNIIKKSRYEKLMNDIIKSGIKTKVLLLSATPVNNSLKDLRNQIYFITGKDKFDINEKIGIKDIELVIKNTQTVFTKWAENSLKDGRDVSKLMEKLDASFFRLLDTLSIARSRKHIKTFYSDEMKRIGAFSERLPVISKYPDIDVKNQFLSYDKINKDITEYKLSLFTPSFYVKDKFKQLYEEKAGKKIKSFTQTKREYYLIGMMKIGFLKRLESSIKSFEITMERTINKIDILIEKINTFKKQKELNTEINYENIAIENEDDEEIVDAYNELFIGKKLMYNLAHLDVDSWLDDLEKDRDSLMSLFNNAKIITPDRDNKLNILKNVIKEKINKPINDNNKKVLIFTAFADTAKYLYDNLVDYVNNELNLNVALVTGGGNNKTTLGKSEFNHILTNFSPKSKGRKDIPSMPQNEEIDILIATDCISEGQNLQDCDFVINYDIHWNPVKIIQRFGRIDRIGSENKKVQMVNFWPTKDLDNYIKLKYRVESKMALVDITTTGQSNLLADKQIEDLINEELKYREKQLKRLKDEVLDLEDIDESLSITDFTLDDFRAELINYMEQNKEKLANTPLGIYSIVPAPSGEYSDYRDYSNLNDKTKSIISPGLIFCFRQINSEDDGSEINPIFPYFLVYIRNDGEVRFNFTHPKQVLEIFRMLSQNIDKPYEKLCNILNNETDNGENMKDYNKLLEYAIRHIRSIFKKRINIRLTGDRDGKIISDKNIPNNTENLELITWLIIK